MPYLQYDLDAKKKVPLMARAAGMDVAIVGWGLLELWEHAWSTKNAVVGALALAGCFGPNPAIIPVLVAHGFLEPVEEGWRVRGADDRLRVRQAQSEGGKKARANLVQNRRRSPEKSSESTSSGLQVHPEEELKSTSGSVPALSPSTQHPTPRTTLPAANAAAAPPEQQQPEAPPPAQGAPDDL